jgi:hypothetical protein
VRHCERRIDGVDAAYEIVVLRRGYEGSQLLAAEREKYPTRRGTQGTHRRRYVRDLDPAVAGNRTPGRPAQRQQRHPRRSRRARGIGGDDGGVGMGGVDERIDALSRKIVGKPVGASEPADPHRHRLTGRRGSAAGKRQRHRKVGTTRKAFRQASGLRRAAENEDAHVSS